MKHLSSGFSAASMMLLAAVIAAGMSGCSMFKRTEDKAPVQAAEAPINARPSDIQATDAPVNGQRYLIEQSPTARDFITGERKFVFCTPTNCGPVSVKTGAVALRPLEERSAKLEREAALDGPRVHKFQVGFDYDKSTLNAAGIAVMEEVAAFAVKNKAREIRIHGKADSYDRDAYNMKLAERRARTAERFLEGKKVEAKLIVDSSIVRVTADGAYPPGETFNGRRADLDIVIEIVADRKK